MSTQCKRYAGDHLRRSICGKGRILLQGLIAVPWSKSSHLKRPRGLWCRSFAWKSIPVWVGSCRHSPYIAVPWAFWNQSTPASTQWDVTAMTPCKEHSRCELKAGQNFLIESAGRPTKTISLVRIISMSILLKAQSIVLPPKQMLLHQNGYCYIL